MDLSRPSIRNGIIAGIVGVIIALAFYVIDVRRFLSLSGLVVLAVYIAFMVMAVREEKKESDFFAFVDGVKTALLTYVVASLMYTIFHFVLMNYIDPDLVELQEEIAIEMVERMGSLMGEEEMEKSVDAIKSQDMRFTPGRALITYGWGLIFPGAIVSLILALIFKDRKPEMY